MKAKLHPYLEKTDYLIDIETQLKEIKDKHLECNEVELELENLMHKEFID